MSAQEKRDLLGQREQIVYAAIRVKVPERMGPLATCTVVEQDLRRAYEDEVEEGGMFRNFSVVLSPEDAVKGRDALLEKDEYVDVKGQGNIVKKSGT